MKFFAILAVASIAVAAPSESPDKRDWTVAGAPCWPVVCGGTTPQPTQQQTVVNLILTTVRTLEAATIANTNAINNAVNAIKNNVDAAVPQLVGVINSSFRTISDTLTAAATSVFTVTAGAVGGIVNSAKGFTEAQINQLAEALSRAINAIKALRASIQLTGDSLTPAVITLVQQTLAAAQNAISPFITPLSQFACAVAQAAPPELSISVLGLGNVINSLLSLVQGLLDSLGLDIIDLDGLGDLLNNILSKLHLTV